MKPFTCPNCRILQYCSVKLHYTTASLRHDRPLVAMSGSIRDQRDGAKNEREDDLPLNLMTPSIICQAAQHNRA